MRMSFSWCDLGIGVLSANVSVCFLGVEVVYYAIFTERPHLQTIYTGHLFTVGWVEFSRPRKGHKIVGDYHRLLKTLRKCF